MNTVIAQRKEIHDKVKCFYNDKGANYTYRRMRQYSIEWIDAIVTDTISDFIEDKTPDSIYKLYNNGISKVEIAERTGYSLRYVYIILSNINNVDNITYNKLKYLLSTKYNIEYLYNQTKTNSLKDIYVASKKYNILDDFILFMFNNNVDEDQLLDKLDEVEALSSIEKEKLEKIIRKVKLKEFFEIDCLMNPNITKRETKIINNYLTLYKYPIGRQRSMLNRNIKPFTPISKKEYNDTVNSFVNRYDTYRYKSINRELKNNIITVSNPILSLLINDYIDYDEIMYSISQSNLLYFILKIKYKIHINYTLDDIFIQNIDNKFKLIIIDSTYNRLRYVSSDIIDENTFRNILLEKESKVTAIKMDIKQII